MNWSQRELRATADVALAADDLLSEVDCITNLTDNTVVASLPTILEKANDKKVPVFGSEIEQVKIGCLAAEGIDYIALGKQTGQMAAQVLKGEKKASEMTLSCHRARILRKYKGCGKSGHYRSGRSCIRRGLKVLTILLLSKKRIWEAFSWIL